MAEAFLKWMGGGGGKTNDQTFFTYIQGRQWRNEKFQGGEEQYYRKTACIKNIFKNGWWEDACPSSSGFTPGHKLQKPSKSLTYFSHLAPLVLFFIAKRQSQRWGGAWHNGPASKYPSECRI